MNYYQFHISDWALHTSHLTLQEEAVYRRLLDFYYDTEKPIPKETKPVIRRLRLTEYSDLVGSILEEFFTLEEDGWHNNRADIEIADYHAKAGRARENGRKGGRPPKENQGSETQPVLPRNPEGTGSKANQEPRTINQEPLTKNQEPDTPPSSQATPQAKPAKGEYPEWFEEIWAVYPTRSGGNDKRKALQAANARLKEGRTKHELLEAVKRYRYFVVATGRISTEYVKMAASFFGRGSDSLDNPWTPPPPGGGGGRPEKFDSVAYVNRNRNAALMRDITPEQPALIGEVVCQP